jgi:hypothetical protein
LVISSCSYGPAARRSGAASFLTITITITITITETSMNRLAFTVLSAHLVRLAGLRHALAIDRSALAHVHLVVDGDAARFTASDGRVLALLKLDLADLADFDGEPADLLLDGPLFIAACSTLLRADHATTMRIVIDYERREMRMTRGAAIAVVGLRDLGYPITSAFLRGYSGKTMVPAIATFAPALLMAASRIAGARQSTLMLWSATPDADLADCWGRNVEPDETIASGSVADLLTQPGFWSDGQLLMLVMPVTRPTTGGPDVSTFLAPAPKAEATSDAA